MHCTLYTLHSTLYTFTLHPHNFALFTLYALWTEPWASFIFMLRTHTYLSTSTSALHCFTSSRVSKGPLRFRRWTFESSPITSHHVGFAECPCPLRATVHHNHMFSSSSPPTYITSIRIGLDVHRTNMPQLQTCSSTLTKKLHSCAVHSVFSCQAPCQASFRPLSPGLKSHVVSSQLFSHHLISSHVILSRLVSSHLMSSFLFSSLLS